MRRPIPERERARVDELDGLRGLLALWVASAHILCWTGFWDFFIQPRPGARLFINFIAAVPAVDTFIILSGFAISFLLHERHQGYGAFMKGRFFRIYPVYLICLALGVLTTALSPFILNTAAWKGSGYFDAMRALAAAESGSTGTHLFWHLTLLDGLLPKTVLPYSNVALLAPAWSISLEWQYYLLAPLIAALVRSGTGMLVLAAVSWFGLRFGEPWQNPHLAFLPGQLPLFLIGIGSYHAYAEFRVSGRKTSLYAVGAAVLLAVAAVGSWHSVGLGLWALAFGGIFVQADGDPFARLLSGIRRVLLHPVLQSLGKISYPLYLVHWPLILLLVSGLLAVRPAISSSQAALVMFSIGLPAILAAAALLHIWVEAPLMAFGKRWKRKERRVQSSTEELARLTPP